jgi:hypothetical protein
MFLSFFTVLTNILVCVSVTCPLIAPLSVPGRLFARPSVVAGIAVNIFFVALSYHFLLRNVWNPQGAQLLADVLLHYVIPLLYVLHWWLYFRAGSLRWSHPALWAVYPAAYFIYALVRGVFVGSYPYGFIDVAAIGYRQAITNGFALLFGFIVLGLVFVGLDRTGRRVEA